MPRTLPTWGYLLIFCGLIVANHTIYRDASAPRLLTVTVFAAGKGTAALVQAPSGATLLIDTGSDASILRALGTILPMWQRSLNTILLTSDSAKNVGGLPFIRDRYKIGEILKTGGQDRPYGAPIIFNKNILITPVAPGVATVSYGTTSLTVSSSTPVGTYTSDGLTIARIK